MTPLAAVNTADLLVAGMKVCRERHRLIASNIANADTPNYSPIELNFQKALEAEIGGAGRVSLRKTQPRHLDAGFSANSSEKHLAFLAKNDYNKVDLEDQVTKLAENTGRYQVFGSILAKQFEETKNMLSMLR